MRLEGKRAVVTGSSRSMGRGIAKLLGAEGAKVVVNASGASQTGGRAIEAVVDEIRSAGGTAIGVAASVDDPQAARALIESCVSAFGGIDILVNNAGIYDAASLGPVVDCSDESWRRTISVDLTGVFNTCRAALPHMVRQRWGRIVNAASVAGTGQFGGSAYAAAKAALFGLGRAMAADHGPYGITVNTYNPEAHPNEDDHSYYPAEIERWAKRGYIRPAEAAFRAGMMGPNGIPPWIAYLCTDEAGYLNGRVFAVDARRIAILGEPEEEKILYRDPRSDGAWSLDTLIGAAPFAFQVDNAWPVRHGDELAAWEALSRRTGVPKKPGQGE